MSRVGWVLLGLTLAAGGQEIQVDGLGGAKPSARHVSLMTESATVKAGKAETVELRFHVDPGYHINSHIPKDELLIPTALRIDAGEGVTARVMEYPAGKPFVLALSGAKETLSVYQDDFSVALAVRAERAGTETLHGGLRYQACDGSQCFPARTLPLAVLVTAR